VLILKVLPRRFPVSVALKDVRSAWFTGGFCEHFVFLWFRPPGAKSALLKGLFYGPTGAKFWNEKGGRGHPFSCSEPIASTVGLLRLGFVFVLIFFFVLLFFVFFLLLLLLFLLLLWFLLILLLSFVLLLTLTVRLVSLLLLSLLLLLLLQLWFLLILLLLFFLLQALAIGFVRLLLLLLFGALKILILLLTVYRRLRIRTILVRGRLLIVDSRLRRAVVVVRLRRPIVAVIFGRRVCGRLARAIGILRCGLRSAIIVWLNAGRLAGPVRTFLRRLPRPIVGRLLLCIASGLPRAIGVLRCGLARAVAVFCRSAGTGAVSAVVLTIRVGLHNLRRRRLGWGRDLYLRTSGHSFGACRRDLASLRDR
jgi:hypothetical protein